VGKRLVDHLFDEAQQALSVVGETIRLPDTAVDTAEQWLRARGFDVQRIPGPDSLFQWDLPELQWDGTTLRAANGSGLIHEFAHFVVAAPRRRSLPGFGLGGEPEGVALTKAYVNPELADREETLASLLGILIERHLGDGWVITFIDHDWVWQDMRGNPLEWTDDASEGDHMHDVLKTLQERGLVDDHANPILSNLPPWQPTLND
jgi:hypothetical protein